VSCLLRESFGGIHVESIRRLRVSEFCENLP
jgi:hypothetical protein